MTGVAPLWGVLSLALAALVAGCVADTGPAPAEDEKVIPAGDSDRCPLGLTCSRSFNVEDLSCGFETVRGCRWTVNGQDYVARIDTIAGEATFRVDDEPHPIDGTGCYTLTSLAPKWGFHLPDPQSDGRLLIFLYRNGQAVLQREIVENGRYRYPGLGGGGAVTCTEL